MLSGLYFSGTYLLQLDCIAGFWKDQNNSLILPSPYLPINSDTNGWWPISVICMFVCALLWERLN